jgi:ribonuclease H2 subunit A
MSDKEDVIMETPPTIFIPPSIHPATLLTGASYTHFSPVPPRLLPPDSIAVGEPCILGIDEAGRGPVLGPMVYSAFYLPTQLSDPLLREQHRFDDSKVLTPEIRSALMEKLCTPCPPTTPGQTEDGVDEEENLYTTCGWAISALSARDISSNMLLPVATYNLNAQALDATVELIKGVLSRGVNITDVYVDTVGPPATYQAKLQRFFPSVRVTVAKKADSLYPCVSAASVCAKVTRDAALEVLYKAQSGTKVVEGKKGQGGMEWGSGYPADARCVSWLRGNMHPLFGWGPECRFSWGTAKDLMEGKQSVKVDWPAEDAEENNARMTDFFSAGMGDKNANELGSWYGTPAGLEAF